jgi:hypothetical protein
MTLDDTDERHAVAVSLAGWINRWIEAGADPETLACAIIGIGVDLASQTIGDCATANAIEVLVDELRSGRPVH